ncbi:2-oxoacid:acceptor oxidoreductase subunit alpha [bacterium]|nr:2-oxoacid:acceptor oxidoreductase subunit alpha [bacterium]
MRKKFTILIGGEAGQGVAKTSLLFGKAFSRLGYYVFIYRDYPSLIRGGHNFDVITISNEPVFSQEDNYDLIIALDQNTINLHQENSKNGGFIIGNVGFGARQNRKIINLDLQKIISKIKGASSVFNNDILAGYLFKYFGLPLNPLLKASKDEFGGKQLLEKTIKKGYNLAKTEKKLFEPSSKRGKYFLSGSQAVGSGAIAAGIDIYIAYPITPATPVLHFLAARQAENNFSVLQLENEIAVANTALGASFGGAMTMIGTSGAGLSLMSEAMSMQGMSEIPLVVYLSQRTGPATGVPTYSSQGDLDLILNIGHGEFPRIVVAPGDPNETFLRTIEAFYLAYKYRLLSLLVLDKHLSESYFSFDKIDRPSVKPKRNILQKPPEDYKSYKIAKNGISPRAVPGQGPVVRATSYEHDEYGYTIEDQKTAVAMNNKRFAKLAYLKKEIDNLNPVSTYGRGKNLVIGWGSTKGAIIDSLPALPGVKFLQISYLSPFPARKVKQEIQRASNVILVENNVTGLLGKLIAQETGYQIKNKVLKYDSRPFSAGDVIKGVKKYIK